MKKTVTQFEETLPELMRKRVMSIRTPHPAGRIAMVNHEDNFILYFAGQCMDVIVEEFILLDDQKQAGDELYAWFNGLDNVAFRVPIIVEILKKIYAELR